MRLDEMKRWFADSTGAVLTLKPVGLDPPKAVEIAERVLLSFDGTSLEFSTTSGCVAKFGEATVTGKDEDDLTAAELEEDLEDLLATKSRYEADGRDGFLRYSDYRESRSRSR